MKKFNFSLNGLLKIRKFKEYDAKLEIAKVNKKIFDLNERKKFLEESLREGYESQHNLIKGGIKGRNVQFFSNFFYGMRSEIEQIEEKLIWLEKEYEEKIEKYHVAKSELKLVDDIKGRQFKQFKKEEDKKLQDSLFEIFLINNQSKKKIK